MQRPLPTVLLTDTTQWAPGTLTAFRDSMQRDGKRLVVSGYPGEDAAALTARLPWLLQPGTRQIVYDPRLAGDAARDSIAQLLDRIAPGVTFTLLPLTD